MKERDVSLDAVKGFAILLVLFGHCLVWNNLSATDPYIYDFIKAVQMPLFMMVSGYLAGLGRKERNLIQTGQLIAKRAAAYLIPFFVWPMLLHPTHPLREIAGILWQLDKGLWFLGTLFIVMVITVIAQFLASGIVKPQSAGEADGDTKNHGRGDRKTEALRLCAFLIILLAAYVLFFMQNRSGNTFLSPNLTLTYLPYYAAGYVWTAYVKRLELWCVPVRITKGLWWGALVVFLCFVIVFDLQKSESLSDIVLQMAAGMTGCFVCFYGIYRMKEGKMKEAFSKIGVRTLELYIFQYAMHAAFVRVRGLGDTQYSLYCAEGVLTVIITFLLMCIVSAAGVFVISKIPVLDAVLFGHLTQRNKREIRRS
ncbi:MAG: hypothetical protein E7294_03960 [Lachnospiraceae bacterium]|nr:hypothetical protein [Lachnospiraceae bacterium]